jgi:hypothetical protein
MSCIRWSPTEKRILREFYPLHGVSGTRKALARAGYERTGDSIVSARKRYGIYKDEPPASPKPVDLSPTRPLTLDSVEMAHWFAQRGFTPEKIAKEINRPLSVVRELLQVNPLAVDKPDYWPRSECAMAGRLSSTVSNFKQGRAIA